MISDVSASADMIIALPSRSRSFFKRSKSDWSSAVISSSDAGIDTASTTLSRERATSERLCRNV